MIDAIKSAFFTGPGKLFGVRSIVALTLTASAAYLWIIGEPVTDAHLAVVVGYDSLYAGARFASTK